MSTNLYFIDIFHEHNRQFLPRELSNVVREEIHTASWRYKLAGFDIESVGQINKDFIKRDFSIRNFFFLHGSVNGYVRVCHVTSYHTFCTRHWKRDFRGHCDVFRRRFDFSRVCVLTIDEFDRFVNLTFNRLYRFTDDSIGRK